MVEKRLPANASIGRFKNSARDGAKVISLRVAGDAGNCEHPAPSKWTNVAPVHGAEKFLIINLCCERKRQENKRKHETQFSHEGIS